MSAISALLLPSQRRTIRFSVPAAQLKLALGVLGTTLAFGALIAANSYAAFGRLLGVALEVAPAAFATDIEGQTGYYLVTSLSLLLGFALAVVALCAAFVNRLAGPTVALERQVRALRFGDYSARVCLRDGDSVHLRLARQLNELAEGLQREQRDSVRRALAEVDED
jgi:hypothetical protein